MISRLRTISDELAVNGSAGSTSRQQLAIIPQSFNCDYCHRGSPRNQSE